MDGWIETNVRQGRSEDRKFGKRTEEGKDMVDEGKRDERKK